MYVIRNQAPLISTGANKPSMGCVVGIWALRAPTEARLCSWLWTLYNLASVGAHTAQQTTWGREVWSLSQQLNDNTSLL